LLTSRAIDAEATCVARVQPAITVAAGVHHPALPLLAVASLAFTGTALVSGAFGAVQADEVEAKIRTESAANFMVSLQSLDATCDAADTYAADAYGADDKDGDHLSSEVVMVRDDEMSDKIQNCESDASNGIFWHTPPAS
jgi:hypothetical protein